jgi:hypothetical protein
MTVLSGDVRSLPPELRWCLRLSALPQRVHRPVSPAQSLELLRRGHIVFNSSDSNDLDSFYELL